MSIKEKFAMEKEIGILQIELEDLNQNLQAEKDVTQGMHEDLLEAEERLNGDDWVTVSKDQLQRLFCSSRNCYLLKAIELSDGTCTCSAWHEALSDLFGTA